MTQRLSKVRLYSMRFLYLLIVVVLGLPAWSTIINKGANWDPLHGVAFSFWAGLSALALLGVRFPVKMLPLLLLQFSYKLIWLIGVAYPLWSAGKLNPMTDELFKACGLGVLLDLIIIPWPYVFKSYIMSVFSLKAADQTE